ncbi:MAG: PQQ-binding-like beta-propeller repeat protein [Planctomycetes bacterium]|nr:PQQ-binding-like beta-propeller repeat protein [Planctomycetota bacterium]
MRCARFGLLALLCAAGLAGLAGTTPTFAGEPAKGTTGPNAAAPGAMDWPQWRGPNRDGTMPGCPKLLDQWPKEGPRLLWKSERIPGGGGNGVSHPVVADGKVFVYVNWKHPLGTKDENQVKPYNAEVLRDWGWIPELPADLAQKIEEARVSPSKPKFKGISFLGGMPQKVQDEMVADILKKNPELAKYIQDFLAKLDPSAAQQYGPYAKRRICHAGFTWEQLGRFAAIVKDQTFSESKKVDELLKSKGFTLDLELKKCGMNQDEFNKCFTGIAWARAYTLVDTVVCLDAATGKALWKKEFPLFDLESRLNYAGFSPGNWTAGSDLVGIPTDFVNWFGSVSTPAVWGGRCYVKGLLSLYCLSAKDGAVLWEVKRSGTHSSVLVADGVVYAGGEAYDADSGKPLWKGGGNGRSSPILWASGQNKYLIVDNSCLDLRTGKVVWKSDWSDGGGITPVLSGDTLVASNGAYKLTPEKAELLWKMPDIYMGSSDCTSPIVYQDYIYWYHDWYSEPDWWCIDLKTGKVQWKQKSLIPSGTSISSPILVDGKIIRPNGDGHSCKPFKVEMLQATPEKFVQLSVFDPGALYFCSPALAGGRLYLRTADGVSCYDLVHN